MTRQEANRKILAVIAAEIESQPDMRFHQILQNLMIVRLKEDGTVQDQYYEEPDTTLQEMMQF